VRNQRLDELAERVAALENAVAGSRESDLDMRLLAIETALRRLSHGEGELDALAHVLRSCDSLAKERVPAGEAVLLAWRGDPAMLGLSSRPAIPFPRPTGVFVERDFMHGASAIANLEAQRAEGLRFLLVPEHARLWLEDLTSFHEHLSARYELIADEEGAGLLFDVGTPRVDEAASPSLVDALDGILDGERYAPVLDWTAFGLGSLAKDRGIFAAPPDTDGELPYLDRSIDVVVVDDPAHIAEARRVATSAVLLAEPDQAGGIQVTGIERMASEAATLDEVALIELGADGPLGIDVVETEIVAIAEPGVLPLPGCLEIAAGTLERDETVAAVAVKLLDADGLLEGAGFAVFADGSAEGIGAGSADVAAPWHDFVRPVCAGAGLLVVRAAAVRESGEGAASLIDLSGRLRAAGRGLLYQPDAWAVRVRPDDSSSPTAGEAWSGVLAARPERPDSLDDSVWRWLLVHDDPEDAWR
jgi:hypothetical protein